MNRIFRPSNPLFKLCVLVMLTVMTCFTVVACSSASDTAGGVQNVVVATEDDYPPYDFLKDGKHVGYNQDLLDLITKNAPFTVKQEILPFQGILTGIATNKYDATNAAVAILPERLATVDFTMPTADITNYLLKRKGDPINSAADLAGKTIGVQQGSITALLVANVVNPQLKSGGKSEAKTTEYGAFAEAYQDLENKRLDVVINNLVALTETVQAKPDGFEIVKEPVGDQLYAAWAVKKGNDTVLKAFNDGLAKAKADGSLKALQEKWLKVSFNLPDKPMLPGNKEIPAS